MTPDYLQFNCRLSPPDYSDLVAERAERITRLVEKPMMMTPQAAAVVVDAAMFGIGCVEGTVRARIQADKEKANVEGSKNNSGPV